MQEPTIEFIPDIPVYIKTILNGIAFLIAAVTMWYGYFVRGKKRAGSPVPQISPATPSITQLLDPNTVKDIGGNVSRIANSLDEMARLMRQNAIEVEIERRVKERIDSIKGS